ncbi:multiheme c-type cytochrome, partial [Candidatus Latescibacterota bacterium]
RKLSQHVRIGIIALLCLAAIVISYAFALNVSAQKTGSGESSTAVVTSEDEDTEGESLLSIFGKKDDSEAKSQIHPYVKDKEQCAKCHDVRQMAGGATYIVFEENSGAVQTVNCKGCHTQHLGDHPVLVQPLFHVPKDLPLSKKGEVTCMTCHNTHYTRYSDRSWSPRSYKSKVLDYLYKKKEYKTYFLRRNNSKKELCISCHTGVRHQRVF